MKHKDNSTFSVKTVLLHIVKLPSISIGHAVYKKKSSDNIKYFKKSAKKNINGLFVEI